MKNKKQEIINRINKLGVKVEHLTEVGKLKNSSWVLPTKEFKGKLELTFKNKI